MRVWRWLLVLAAASLLVACGGGGKQGIKLGGAGGGQGTLLITRDQALYGRDMSTGKETRLFSSPPDQFIFYPTWSPDGTHFAYLLQTQFQGNVATDWGTDLYEADANGTNQKLLLKHDHPGVDIESPSWTPDGKAIVFSYNYTAYDQSGKSQGSTLETRRFDLASGAVTTLVKNGAFPELCADGSKLMWVNFPLDGSSPEAIMVGGADGSSPRAVVTADVSDTGNGLQDFSNPRFSPDCSRIIFAAVGGDQSTRQLGAPSRNPLARLIGALAPAPAEAHGPPWDLWGIALDGSGLARLTHVAEDLPFADWSADGRTVLFIGTYGIYQMPATGGGLKKIDQGTVHGQIAWLQK